MIVIIGSCEEEHSKFICDILESKGEDVSYLDSRKIPNDFITSWYADNSQMKGNIYLDNKKIAFQDIKSIYWRWFYGINVYPKTNSEQDHYMAGILTREYTCYVDSLFQNLDCLWINSLNAINLHKTKIHQLKLMAKEGIRVPKTLVTNDRNELKAFVESYDCEFIFKPVRGGAHTEKFDRESFNEERMNHLKYCPASFQEKANGVDIRVYCVGDKIFSAEIRTQDIDFRTDPHAEIIPVDLPDFIEKQCFRIMEMFDLKFTGIDIKYNPEKNEYIFIEANPSPMFIYFERKSGFPISENLINMLIKGK